MSLMQKIANLGKGMMTAASSVIDPPYVGASLNSQELSNWQPGLNSADGSYLWDRNTIVSRSRDLVRNSGWASSAISRHLDNVIGTGFRLSAKPDYAALGLTPEQGAAFAEQLEMKWRLFADDPDNRIDASRHDNFYGLLGLAFRHRLIDGEAFAIALWLKNPNGGFSTTLQIIDPDRVSNPNGAGDSDTLRAGIELSQYGAPLAYHVRLAHPSDWASGAKSFTWERIARETPWGRRVVLHAYEKERAGQTRGISILAPVIERLKMIDKYDRLELKAAVLNAILAAYIESPFDHDLLDGVLSPKQEGDSSAPAINAYQDIRSAYHKQNNIQLEGTSIPKLFPGEKLSFQTAQRPAAQFGEFEKACLRNIAAGTGLSYEQLSQDWSSTNYSSARAALLEVWKFLMRERTRFAEQFATPVYLLWLEEAIERGDIILPPGAPDFYSAKAAYSRVKWIGSPRGWIDPVKEAQAAQMRMDMGISTLEDECAEQGKDWREQILQRHRELAEMDRLGLPRPAWAQIPHPNQSNQNDTKEATANG